jgi:hypothetical protein
LVGVLDGELVPVCVLVTDAVNVEVFVFVGVLVGVLVIVGVRVLD